MKDTVISTAMKKREITIFLVCFIVAFVINVVGIIKYHSPFIELISQLHIVLLISIVIYLLVGIFRVIFYLISLLLKKVI